MCAAQETVGATSLEQDDESSGCCCSLLWASLLFCHRLGHIVHVYDSAVVNSKIARRRLFAADAASCAARVSVERLDDLAAGRRNKSGEPVGVNALTAAVGSQPPTHASCAPSRPFDFRIEMWGTDRSFERFQAQRTCASPQLPLGLLVQRSPLPCQLFPAACFSLLWVGFRVGPC